MISTISKVVQSADKSSNNKVKLCWPVGPILFEDVHAKPYKDVFCEMLPFIKNGIYKLKTA